VPEEKKLDPNNTVGGEKKGKEHEEMKYRIFFGT
jgi:hypothetical protein